MSQLESGIEELDSETLRRIYWREIVAERVGWLLIFLVISAAALGFLGRGLYCEREASSADGSLVVRYSAIERVRAPAELEIRAHRSDGDTIRIGVSRSFIERVTPSEITPRPIEVQVGPDRIVYLFRRVGSGDGAGGRGWSIQLRYKYEVLGRNTASISLGTNASVEISQLVLP